MKVFVYGSLKKGFHNHSLLSELGAEFLDTFVTKPEYTMFSLGSFPAIKKQGNTPIFGEVYEVPDIPGIRTLDKLEGHPRWYRRELIPTHVGDAWVYILLEQAPQKASICEDGNWRLPT